MAGGCGKRACSSGSSVIRSQDFVRVRWRFLKWGEYVVMNVSVGLGVGSASGVGLGLCRLGVVMFWVVWARLLCGSSRNVFWMVFFGYPLSSRWVCRFFRASSYWLLSELERRSLVASPLIMPRKVPLGWLEL